MQKNLTITDELKRLSRRIDELSKSIEIVRGDRDILEDILLRLGLVEETLQVNRSKQNEVTNDIKANIKAVEFAVEEKVDEVHRAISDKSIMVLKQSIFDKISKLLKRKEVK